MFISSGSNPKYISLRLNVPSKRLGLGNACQVQAVQQPEVYHPCTQERSSEWGPHCIELSFPLAFLSTSSEGAFQNPAYRSYVHT